MTIKRIFLAAFVFAVMPIPYSVGHEAPLKEDVKYDDVQANPDDYQNIEADKNKSSPRVMIANCSPPSCTTK